jgi:hypothetical protein
VGRHFRAWLSRISSGSSSVSTLRPARYVCRTTSSSTVPGGNASRILNATSSDIIQKNVLVRLVAAASASSPTLTNKLSSVSWLFRTQTTLTKCQCRTLSILCFCTAQQRLTVSTCTISRHSFGSYSYLRYFFSMIGRNSPTNVCSRIGVPEITILLSLSNPLFDSKQTRRRSNEVLGGRSSPSCRHCYTGFAILNTLEEVVRTR